jgi:NAD(P)-dependent dehydrogenase (short-subunit alcohol dehydrogenase family)
MTENSTSAVTANEASEASGADLGFDGKVAIITGAGGGLGRQHALMLAKRGALIVVNDLGGAVDGTGSDKGAAQLVVDEITAAGGEAVANTDSVATPEGGKAIVQSAVDAFGRVDIVINNAGILRDKSFHNMGTDLVDPVLDVHLRGAFNVTQPAWQIMREQGYGRIVSTSSAAGIFGNFGQANYGAAKMGLVGFTNVLAVEGAKHNVKANAIAPLALTRMTEDLLGGLGDKLDPALVSPLVTWLSHESCDSTGRVYSVGGGRVAEVFIAETVGYTNTAGLTPEDLRDHWATVTDQAGYAVPANLADETALFLNALK